MLLDSRHTRWILVVVGLAAVASAVYVPYHVRSLNGPSGGSWIGLGFGVAALGLMVFAGLLGARRRVPAWRVGRPETWMRGHLWLGLLTVPLAFFHAGFQFGGALTLTLMILLILVTCGLWGIYVAYRYPTALNEIERAENVPGSDIMVICVVLTVVGIGFISTMIIQDQLNRHWRLHAGPQPNVAT